MNISGGNPAPAGELSMAPRVYGDFEAILRPDGPWMPGGFALPDGGFWRFQEPNAAVIVQDGRLRVTAAPLTRSHDRVQFLDNAKHMYFSRDRIDTPPSGSVSFEITIAARVFGGKPGDLYDGFVSFNLLDFNTGFALDFFAGNDQCATVYGRLPFPGVPVPQTGPVRYFCLFKELDLPGEPGDRHTYRISYDRDANRLEWLLDGTLVNTEEDVPDTLEGFTLAMGLMTEKEIGSGGSRSLHGQGLQGEWSPVTITTSRNAGRSGP